MKPDSLWTRLKLAVHVLRGRSLMYRTYSGPVVFLRGNDHLKLQSTFVDGDKLPRRGVGFEFYFGVDN